LSVLYRIPNRDDSHFYSFGHSRRPTTLISGGLNAPYQVSLPGLYIS